MTWNQEMVVDPATGEQTTKWTQNTNLSEGAQGLYDNQLGMMGGKSDLALGMNDRIASEMGSAPDWGQFGDAQGLQYSPDELRARAEADAYGRETMRLDPQFNAERSALETRLKNQGLSIGDQAYDSAINTFDLGKNDAYERARLGATSTGMQEAGQLWDQQMGSTQMANSLRDQKIAEYLGQREFSLGEQNKLNQGGDLTALAQLGSGGGA